MRLIFSYIVLSALALSFDAHAAKNEDIYKHCKKYADNAFEYNEPTDAMCLTYFAGVRDSGMTLCNVWRKQAEKDGTIEGGMWMNLFAKSMGVGKISNMNAAIQIYVNAMQNEPKKWNIRADFSVLQSLQELAPCE
ncbi:hypothetical protein N9N21_07090 [Alphaproteobacteria bacterium]|nr:hypothetical protein [Alphaproteobacteria bacterium]